MRRKKVKILLKIIGALTLVEGLALLPCLFVSYISDPRHTANTIFTISVLYIFAGAGLLSRLKAHRLKLKTHEGFMVSTFCWVYCSILGAVPYFFAGDGFSVIQSLFEASAGFTTTGCTVISYDLMPKGLIMWRAVTNWIGGMGILVLVVSFLPKLGIGGQSIAATETTGPSLEKVGGRFSSTGQFLYVTYTLFTLIEFVLLAAGPLSAFDALVNTCSSISTGGLLVTPENAHAFTTVYVKVVIMIFTLLSSMNYLLYYFMINGRRNAFTSNAEVKTYWLIIGICTILITLDLVHEKVYTNVLRAFLDSLSQVISFISTSGYYVCNYSRWPTFAIIMLFGLLIIGGCSMSTSGSLKVIRVLVFLKMIARGIFRQIHPSSVRAIKIAGRPVSALKAGEITAHILLYFLVLFFSMLVISLDNLSMEATITTAIGVFTNTGIAFGGPGATGDFSMFSDFTLLYMSLLMIVGRLEMFTVIILFTRSFRQINRPEQI